MKKIRVLQYTGAMNRGGAETLLMNIYRMIDRNQFEFHFITHSKEKSDYDDEILMLGGKIIYLEKPNYSNLSSFKKSFAKIVKENGPYNAIHAHVQLFNGLVLNEAKKNFIDIRVSHAHLNGDYQDTNIKRIVYRLYSRYTINKTSTHRLSCSAASGKYLYGNKQFKKINNAINLEEYNIMDVNYLKEELKLSNEKKLITHVGTFKEAKNHKFILDVFNALIQKDSNYRLILVGRGELQQEIQKIVNNLNLQNFVFFLGVRSDVNKILSSSDIFLMPSILEGLPVVLIEAQASGLNCIVSSNIPKECDMGLNLVSFIDLNEKIDTWVQAIIDVKSSRIDFESRKEGIIKCGYDLEQNVNYFSHIYKGKV